MSGGGAPQAARDRDQIPAMFKHVQRRLQEKGRPDPDVDMFVAVFDNDTTALKTALSAGADTSVTDGVVLSRHHAELEDFEFVRPEDSPAPTGPELAEFMKRAADRIGGKAGDTVEHFGRAAITGSADDRETFRRLISALMLDRDES